MSEPLLRVRQVAEILDVSSETVLRWVRAGKFEDAAMRLPGGALRFWPDRLAMWMDNRGVAAPGPEAPATSTGAAGAGYPESLPFVVPATRSAKTAPDQKEDGDAC